MSKRILYLVLSIVALCSFVSCNFEPDEFQDRYSEMTGVWFSNSNKAALSFNNKGEGYFINSYGYIPVSVEFFRNNGSVYVRYSMTIDGVKNTVEMPEEDFTKSSDSEGDAQNLSDKPAIVSGISKIHDPNIVGSWGEADVYNSDGTGKCNLYVSGAYVLMDMNWSTNNGVLTRVFYKDGAVYKTVKTTYIIYEKDGRRWFKQF